VFGGGSNNRNITLTPAPNQTGTSVVSIMVVDAAFGATNQSFVFTVTPVNDPPLISTIPDQTLIEDSASAPIPFTVSDVETAAAPPGQARQRPDFPAQRRWRSLLLMGAPLQEVPSC